jgi:hypothetical protein
MSEAERRRNRRARRGLGAVLALLLGVGAGVAWWRAVERELAPLADAVPVVVARAPESATGGVEPSYSPLADELHAEGFDAAHDGEVLSGLIAQFTTTLRLGERPPLGDNADITAALTGANRRRLVFIPSLHSALSDGLLVDRWGTPYHFHARAADVIDVRSAGADRVLFTADDLESGGASFYSE